MPPSTCGSQRPTGKGQFSLSTTWILGIELMSLFFKREQHYVLDHTSWWHKETENCTFNTNPFWMSFKRRWDCILLFWLRGFKNYTVSPRVFIHVCNDLNISMLSHVNTKETDKQTKQYKKALISMQWETFSLWNWQINCLRC